MASKAGDPVAALAREVERLGRDHDTLRGQFEDLAQVVAQRAKKQGGGAPAPSWLAQDDPAEAGDLLRDLYGWVDAVFLRYPDAVLPTCWQWHPWVVEELLWLAASHRAAYDTDTGTVAAAGDWHDKQRPGVAERIRTAIGNCALDDHQPGRHEARQTRSAPLQHASDAVAFTWTDHRSTPSPSDVDLERAREHDEQTLTPNY